MVLSSTMSVFVSGTLRSTVKRRIKYSLLKWSAMVIVKIFLSRKFPKTVETLSDKTMLVAP